MSHLCADCGFEHEPPVVEEVPEEIVEEVTDANVEIARIEGDTAVKIAKIEAGVAEDAVESRLAELEGQVRGMREVLDRVIPPAPEPVETPAPVVTVVDDNGDDEMPPKAEHPAPPKPKKSTSYFGF